MVAGSTRGLPPWTVRREGHNAVELRATRSFARQMIDLWPGVDAYIRQLEARP